METSLDVCARRGTKEDRGRFSALCVGRESPPQDGTVIVAVNAQLLRRARL